MAMAKTCFNGASQLIGIEVTGLLSSLIPLKYLVRPYYYM